MAELERIVARIEADTAQFRAELGRADRSTQQFRTRFRQNMTRAGRSAERFTKSLTSMRAALGLVAGATGLFIFGKRAIETADQIGKTADRIGFGVEALQELRFAAEVAGVNTRTLDMALQRFSRRVGEAANNSGELSSTLEQYNIAVTDSEGRTRDASDVLNDLADAIQNAGSSQEQLRISFKAFDSEGAALVNLMREGADAVEGLRAQARELGVVLAEDTVRRAEAANDELTKMSRVLSVAATSAGLELLPALRDLAQAIQSPEFRGALRDLSQLFAELVVLFVNYHKEILTVSAGLLALSLSLRATAGLSARNRTIISGLVAAIASAVTATKLWGDENDEASDKIEKLSDQVDQLTGGGGSVPKATRDIGELTKEMTTQNDAISDLIGTNALLGRSAQRLGDDLSIQEAALSNNIDLTTEAGARWLGAARKNQRLRNQTSTLQRVLEDIQTPQQQYNEELKTYKALLEAGALTQEQFNQAVENAKERLEDAGDSGKRTNDVMRDLGATFESAFVDAITQGRELSDVLQGLERDLLRLFVRRAIAGPLFGAFEQLGTNLMSSSAKGNVFSGPVRPFGRGGVVNRPRLFPMARGVGLMSEAGPEAILPLRRGRDGNLGVAASGGSAPNVQVQVFAPPGSSVRREERRGADLHQIRVFIDETVGDLVQQDGSQTNRGVTRTFGLSRQLSPVRR